MSGLVDCVLFAEEGVRCLVRDCGFGCCGFPSFLGGCVFYLASIVRFWTLVEDWSGIILTVTDGLRMFTLEIWFRMPITI